MVFGSDQANRLIDWYRVNARALPWRESRDPYRVMISELMLQQTTVAAVIPLYLHWMERFPTLHSLAMAPKEDVMRAWSGLGYYSRATRLHQAARQVHSAPDYPQTLQGWMALPGFGPYSAAAVVSIAYGVPHLALDTNAVRVLYRFFGWSLRADDRKAHVLLRQSLEQSLVGFDFGEINQAIMELGASLCRVRAPLCASCPLRGDCRAEQTGEAATIPLPRPRTSLRPTPARAYLIGTESNCVTLVQGTALGLLDQLYQPLIDFGPENRSSWSFSPLLLALRKETDQLQPSGRLGYSISGRKLELGLYCLSSALWDERLRALASQHAHPTATVQHRLWQTSSPPLSSLSRKLLKVWEETL